MKAFAVQSNTGKWLGHYNGRYVLVSYPKRELWQHVRGAEVARDDAAQMKWPKSVLAFNVLEVQI